MTPEKLENNRPVKFLNQLVWALNRRVPSQNALRVKTEDFESVELPSHLQPFFELLDNQGKRLAESTDLHQLKTDYQHLVEKQIQTHQSKTTSESKPITQWDFGDLPAQKTIRHQGAEIVVFPALELKPPAGRDFSVETKVAASEPLPKVYLSVLSDPSQAQEEHGKAVLWLLRQTLVDKEKYLLAKLPMKKACLCYAPYGTCKTLTQQVIDRALIQVVEQPERIRKQADFEQALESLRQHWIEQAQEIAKHTQEVLTLHQKVAKQITGRVNPRWLASIADIRMQLDQLISKDFVRETPQKWFKQMPRYLLALQTRLQKIDQDPSKDQIAIRQMQGVLTAFEAIANDPAYHAQAEVVEIRWLLEELRISLFSQPMKTLQPVSIQRIEKRLKAL